MSQASSDKVVKTERRVFAIGDIHGCALELEALIRKLKIRNEDLVIFLGDYIDRGPDSARVVDIVLDLKRKCEVITLIGNHEAMFLDFLERPETPGSGMFILNGGASTLAAYTRADGSIGISDAHLKFFKELKYFYETKSHFFVHAGVPNQPLSTLNEKDHGHQMIWSRQPFLSSNYNWEKIIVHGHTPVEQVEIRDNRINLDTGCVYDRKLTAMEFPSRKIYAVDKGVRGEPPLYPKEFIQSARASTRFPGRVTVCAQREGEALRTFETLNLNQFGFLMKEVPKHQEPSYVTGDRLVGKVGDDPQSQIDFIGQVVRYESRGGVQLYGVKLESLSSELGMPQPGPTKTESSG